MTPTQRTAALRLADYLSADEWPGGLDAMKLDDAAALLRELAAEPDWESLRDPETLHANLLRGLPAQLSREQFLHLAGEPQSEPVAWLGPLGQLMHNDIYEAWAAAYPQDEPERYAPLYAHPPRTAPLHSVIAGALFDFLGFLTTRDTVTPFGSTAAAAPAADLLQQWAGKRGLAITEADVAGWAHGIGETK